MRGCCHLPGVDVAGEGFCRCCCCFVCEGGVDVVCCGVKLKDGSEIGSDTVGVIDFRAERLLLEDGELRMMLLEDCERTSAVVDMLSLFYRPAV